MSLRFSVSLRQAFIAISCLAVALACLRVVLHGPMLLALMAIPMGGIASGNFIATFSGSRLLWSIVGVSAWSFLCDPFYAYHHP